MGRFKSNGDKEKQLVHSCFEMVLRRRKELILILGGRVKWCSPLRQERLEYMVLWEDFAEKKPKQKSANLFEKNFPHFY